VPRWWSLQLLRRRVLLLMALLLLGQLRQKGILRRQGHICQLPAAGIQALQAAGSRQ
jgi:hypothetical protein